MTTTPFNAVEWFVKAGVGAANCKFAPLLRRACLEGGNRQKSIFAKALPSRVWVLSARITF